MEPNAKASSSQLSVVDSSARLHLLNGNRLKPAKRISACKRDKEDESHRGEKNTCEAEKEQKLGLGVKKQNAYLVTNV